MDGLDQLLYLLERKYGDLKDDGGCYVMNEETGEYEWLSVKTIVRLIEQAREEI